jgi:putative hydrolase of the HAD superfamily
MTPVMQSYRHLFFDLDHTLWDFEQNSAHTLRILYDTLQLSDRGIESFEQFRIIYSGHNERLWERFRKGFIRRDALRWKRMWHTLIDFKIGDEQLAHTMSDLYLQHLPNQSQLLPFAIDVLDYCRTKEYQIHLITNGFETTQWQKMRRSGIDHYFSEVITSEASNSLKPHREIFQYAVDRTGAKVSESLMIGDALEVDVLGAKQFGMDQVYFNPAKQQHDVAVTYEISCLSELKNIL